MKKLAVLLALCLPLMAAQCDAQLQSYAVKTCNALDVIFTHYDKVAEDGVIPAKIVNRVAAVRAQTDKVCASPQTVNTVVLAGIAGEAYFALRAAFQAGQGEGDASYEAEEGLYKLEYLRAMLQKARN